MAFVFVWFTVANVPSGALLPPKTVAAACDNLLLNTNDMTAAGVGAVSCLSGPALQDLVGLHACPKTTRVSFCAAGLGFSAAARKAAEVFALVWAGSQVGSGQLGSALAPLHVHTHSS